MPDNQLLRAKNLRFRSVFAAIVVITVTLSVLAGLKLKTVENCIILPVSPFSELSFFDSVVKICVADIVMFWIFSLSMHPISTVIVSVFMLFYRGMVIGNGFKIFTQNSVPSVTVCIILSYCAVTLLAIVYNVYLNCMEERGPLCRIFSCFIVTGACAVLRIVPMFFIK